MFATLAVAGKEGGDHRPVMDADDAAAMAAMRTSKQRHGVGDKRKAETGDAAAGSAASLPAAGPGASAHVAAPSAAAPEARAHEQEATPSDAKRARTREADDAVEQGEDAPPGLDDDAAFAAMMGFSSFGSSKKSR
ncbi:hypothetical protein EON66_09360 [archaeon]|nr:MAG: hypothetical protein EON66_09360 [archaeon]